MGDENSEAKLLECDKISMKSPPPYEETPYTRQPSLNPDIGINPYMIPAATVAPGPMLLPQQPNPNQVNNTGFSVIPSQMTPPSTQVTSINVGGLLGVIPVGPKSMRMKCHHCGADIKTSTSNTYKSSAHLACCLIMILTCGICSCIPYCMASCKKVNHKCPNCDGFLGTYVG